MNKRLQKKYDEMAQNELMVETQMMEDAEYAIVAYGTTARIALTAIRQAREQGVKAGADPAHHPVALPHRDHRQGRQAGQKDAHRGNEHGPDGGRRARRGLRGLPVGFYGRTGGVIPGVREIYNEIMSMKEAE